MGKSGAKKWQNKRRNLKKSNKRIGLIEKYIRENRRIRKRRIMKTR